MFKTLNVQKAGIMLNAKSKKFGLVKKCNRSVSLGHGGNPLYLGNET